MNSVLVAMFDSRQAAENAQERLVQAGFPQSMVSLTGSTSSAAPSSSTSNTSASSGEHDGPIVRFFKEVFGSDDSDRDSRSTYEEAFRRGSYGLTVTTTDERQQDRAAELLNECGAVDIDERSQQWRSEGWTGGAGSSADTLASGTGTTGTASASGLTATSGEMRVDDAIDTGTTRTLQEVEEELRVGKRAVARGGVRIHSRLTEVPVQETVTLRDEHAEVQRRAVDRPATEADLAAFKEGTIEVRETGEEAVVAKTARVVGEVEIGKRVTEREETVNDTVRRTQVDVEPIPASGERVRRENDLPPKVE